MATPLRNLSCVCILSASMRTWPERGLLSSSVWRAADVIADSSSFIPKYQPCICSSFPRCPLIQHLSGDYCPYSSSQVSLGS